LEGEFEVTDAALRSVRDYVLEVFRLNGTGDGNFEVKMVIGGD
jgi:hypothetical protein